MKERFNLIIFGQYLRESRKEAFPEEPPSSISKSRQSLSDRSGVPLHIIQLIEDSAADRVIPRGRKPAKKTKPQPPPPPDPLDLDLPDETILALAHAVDRDPDLFFGLLGKIPPDLRTAFYYRAQECSQAVRKIINSPGGGFDPCSLNSRLRLYREALHRTVSQMIRPPHRVDSRFVRRLEMSGVRIDFNAPVIRYLEALGLSREDLP